MKKLLTLLICCSLSVPSFGIDRFIRDRIYTSFSGGVGANVDLGYHYTDSVKISVGPIVKPIFAGGVFVDLGLMTKLHYHYKFESTGVTPYITAGVGIVYQIERPKCNDNNPRIIDENFFDMIRILLKQTFECSANNKTFSYQIGGGINLPLSERMSIFAGYKLQKLHEISHGVEFGVSFNL